MEHSCYSKEDVKYYMRHNSKPAA